MSDADAFLRTIAENPEDDAPRLVFADFLDENGESDRAEYIRLQIAFERTTWAEPLRLEWAVRIRELWKQHGRTWLNQLPRHVGVHWNPEFRRGFPYGVDFRHTKAFRESAEKIFAAAPVTKLHIAKMSPRTVTVFTASPLLSQITEMEMFYCTLGNEGVELLANCTYLQKLKYLNLSANNVGDLGAKAIAESPNFSSLSVIALSQNDIGDDGAFALAESTELAKGERIYVNGNPIGTQAIAALRRRFRRVYEQ